MPGKNSTPPRKPLIRSPIDKAKAYEVTWAQVAPLFEAARPYGGNASFVYFIGEPDDGPIKIGFSKDPIGRLRNMQTGNPRRLRMEYVLVGDMATEKLLHQFWEPNGVRSAANSGLPGIAPGTEWFNPQARAQLLPIIENAVERQIEMMRRNAEEATAESAPFGFSDLERAVREAHSESGYVAHMYAPTIRLAEGAGYVVSRRQRI